jgi:hypothetical protein
MAEMTDDHKAALAQGRRAAAVKAYLASLQVTRKRGRQPSPERVEELKQQAATEPDPLKRLGLVQERLELEKQLAAQRSIMKLSKPASWSLPRRMVSARASPTRRGVR